MLPLLALADRRDPPQHAPGRAAESTRRSTTRSPACRTARCSSDRVAQAIARRDARRRPLARACSSTSTASRRSTTRSATTTATRCCSEVGAAPAGALRDADTVARLGGDEFAVLLPGVPSGRRRGARRAAAARERSREPFELDGLDARGRARASASPATRTTATTPTTLLQRADVAMYVAKASAQPASTLYDARAGPQQPGRLGAGRRAAPGDRRRRARPALPAQGRPARRAGRRRRGAGALAAPDARAAPARRVHPAGRAAPA